MKRRSFIKKSLSGAATLSASSLLAHDLDVPDPSGKDLKLSLAQWSLHRQFVDGNLNPIEFASIAIYTYGINAVEYVNQFYVDSGKDEKFWINMKKRADNVGVRSLLIMVDNEGDLGVANDRERKVAVENHYKWVNAAKILGCHSVRVNAFGEPEKDGFSCRNNRQHGPSI